MANASVATETRPSFEGTLKQQEIAIHAFELMRRQGMLYASDAPISITLDRLVQGLRRQHKDITEKQVADALNANAVVFSRLETAAGIAYETTRSGQRPADMTDTRHMFRHRLNAEAREVTEQESRTLTEGWIAQAQARAESFTIFQEPAAEAAVGAGRWEGPAAIAAYVAPAHPVPAEAPAHDEPVVIPPQPTEAAAVQGSPLPAEPVFQDVGLPTTALPTIPVPIDTPEAAPPVLPAEPELARIESVGPGQRVTETPAAPVVEEAPPAPRPVAPPAPARPVRFTLPTEGGATTVDLSGDLDAILAEHGPQLEAMLAGALRDDFRYASFGDDWYAEDHVERFSKGDFRRIKEYLIETQEALSDRAFLTDVLNRRETDADYERLRFSLNYRMLREKKDFEYVGGPNERLWIVAGASPASAPTRKASELGQDFRYLTDAAIRALEPPVAGDGRRWDHALTYYEYENGILPYDNNAQALLPGPMLEDQRAALLRIEVPTLFQNFPVELRYPTGNRGGYLVGFDAFFQENLVPGSLFTLEATDQQNVLILRFERTAAQEESLLQYDERRSRFVYRPTTYYTATSPDWLLSEKRLPKLDGLKRLDEGERKKTENIVIRAFELVGEEIDGRSLALVSDLLPAVNLERPFSEGALRAVLEAGNHPYFEADPATPGAFFYDPSKK